MPTNKKLPEYVVFHIARNDEGMTQPLILNVRMPFGDINLLGYFLNSARPAAKSIDNDDGTGYLITYDGNSKPPYNSVIVWKYTTGNEDNLVMMDMEEKDMGVIPLISEAWLDIKIDPDGPLPDMIVMGKTPEP